MNKKRWEQIFVFALAAMLLCACQSKSTSTDSETNKQQGIEKEETNSKYDFTKPSTLKMKNAFEYMPKAKLAGVKDGKFLEVPGTDG